MFTSSRRFRTSFIAHYSLPKNLFFMFLCLILLARFAWVKNLGRCTQTSLRFLFSCLLSSRHAELVSASHRKPFFVLLRGQILKRVIRLRSSKTSYIFWMRYGQDDICVLTAHRSSLTAHRSPLNAHRVPLKILYKTVFLYKSSWKVESAQLENFYFPVGKLFFLSWKIKISQ